jgi:hypothetical protein
VGQAEDNPMDNLINGGFMRRKRNIVFVLMIMFLFMACCTTVGLTTQGKTLAISADTYENLYPQFVRFHKAGVIGDADYAKGQAFAQQYYRAWNLYKEAVIANAKLQTVASKAEEDKAMAALNKAVVDMAAFITPLIHGGK